MKKLRKMLSWGLILLLLSILPISAMAAEAQREGRSTVHYYSEEYDTLLVKPWQTLDMNSMMYIVKVEAESIRRAETIAGDQCGRAVIQVGSVLLGEKSYISPVMISEEALDYLAEKGMSLGVNMGSVGFAFSAETTKGMAEAGSPIGFEVKDGALSFLCYADIEAGITIGLEGTEGRISLGGEELESSYDELSGCMCAKAVIKAGESYELKLLN